MAFSIEFPLLLDGKSKRVKLPKASRIGALRATQKRCAQIAVEPVSELALIPYGGEIIMGVGIRRLLWQRQATGK